MADVWEAMHRGNAKVKVKYDPAVADRVARWPAFDRALEANGGDVNRAVEQVALRYPGTSDNQIKRGEVDVVIGTHALIQKDVGFKRLGLAVIDEQHRFGVLQRSALRQKGFNPHVLS